MKKRVAIVTGAAGKGIGRSAALTLARDGMSVVVNYRSSEQEAIRIVDYIRSNGGTANAVQADIMQAGDCERLITTTLADLGSVDVLVIGPGAGWHPAPLGDLAETDAVEDAMAELSPFCNLVTRVVPLMKTKGFGRIIGIGLNLSRPSPSFSYNAAKGAKAAYFEQAWSGIWNHGITMNLVCPGPVEGIDSLEQAAALCGHSIAWQERSKVTPQDIAELIAFLASDQAAFVTGAQIPLMFK